MLVLPPDPTIRVGSISRLPDIRDIRARVLATLWNTTSLSDLADLRGAGPFDVLVVCYSVAGLEFQQVLHVARSWPNGCKVLAISTDSPGTVRHGADLTVSSIEGPGAMLDAVRELLNGDDDDDSAQSPSNSGFGELSE